MSEISPDQIMPTFNGIRAAANRLEGVARKTPLFENAVLNEHVGGRVLLKVEALQHGGAFKFRGAYNFIASLPAERRARGILAWSSGNHAFSVSLVAKHFGCPAVIVMPADAPQVKISAVRANGAETVFYDRYTEDREAIGRRISEERDMPIASPFNHPAIIEGQGTLALEAVAQARELDAEFEQFVVCCGGGGMASGCALALEALAPGCALWLAEPEGYDDACQSLAAGRRVAVDTSRRTLCDALASPMLGDIAFEVLSKAAAGGVAVSEEEVVDAVRFAFVQLKLVVEPGGAAALAALLSKKIDGRGKTTGLTLSGGNVDPQLFAEILNGDD